jgi:hypothetical protein
VAGAWRQSQDAATADAEARRAALVQKSDGQLVALGKAAGLAEMFAVLTLDPGVMESLRDELARAVAAGT